MPAVAPGTLWREPHLLVNSGQQYSLGWQNARKVGHCFVVARLGLMGSVKVLERFPMTAEGWSQAWASLAELDAGAAQAVAKVLEETLAARAAQRVETERQTQLYELFARAGDATEFRLLGVQVLAGQVYTIGFHSDVMKTNSSRLHGPLAGAEAMVTDGAQAWSPGRAMFLPIGLAGLATKAKADAAVVFPDGTVQTVPLDGNYQVREAQKQVVQFNALAGAAAPPATETGNNPAGRLQKLQELRDAGLVTQDEYEMKRAEIINSI